MLSAAPTNKASGTIDMLDLAADRTDRRIIQVSHSPDELLLTWDDGRFSRFHALWLRDNCPCPSCRHPQALERTYKFIDHPAAKIATASLGASGELSVEFASTEGRHASSFSTGWLHRHCYSEAARYERVKRPRLWDRAASCDLPVVDFADYMNTDHGLRAWLEALCSWGIVLMRNAPAEPGKLLEIGRRVGPIRATNFGEYYDVVSMPNPNASAYTAMELELHTDLANWRWPPDYQLLFCVRNDAVGGGSILADGFRVAEDLRRDDPESFDLLSRYPVEFRFHDESCDISASAPTIGLDGDGRLRSVRFNNWLRSTLDVPADVVAPLYRALGRFWERLRDPSYHLTIRLRAGEMLAYSNHRVLHGRESFDPSTGGRHLQGCYITHDDVMSRLRSMDRRS
ncbi:TauD/TfdA family dioxygenase [Dongia deserti]|uniref:TauD/TfdA family dioxygenase n=1 Tax=Dongia deserti TaxID=2268030 RepID=UPI000E64B32C|nr:TauD/TfdA family dioxygenase [Dongia deserti]